MRKLVTTVATAVTLGVMGFAAPAFADSPAPQPGHNQPYKGPVNPNAGPRYDGGQFDQNRFDQNRFDRNRPGPDRFDRNGKISITFDFGRYDRGFDRWERGWGNAGFAQFRFQKPLNTWQLTRRVESQGYYGVRLRRVRSAYGYGAFAFNYRGQPVMLRVNPYTGRVLDVRYI